VPHRHDPVGPVGGQVFRGLFGPDAQGDDGFLQPVGQPTRRAQRFKRRFLYPAFPFLDKDQDSLSHFPSLSHHGTKRVAHAY